MTWGIKDSLIAYIEGPAEGEVEVTTPAVRTDAGFFFPRADQPGETADAAGTPHTAGAAAFAFAGSVRLTGHWGALDVLLADPRITLTGSTGTLAVRDRGHRDPTATLVIADLTLVPARASSQASDDEEGDAAGDAPNDGTRDAPGGADADADTGADAESWLLTATLTPHGRFLLGAQYRVGEDLSPLRVVLPSRS
ncbi:hypothetical protein BGP79_09420 [Tersicoccus sp. Bi-70]|nr:hypothetical protein BGP79_09420 [Tersicoccus sp. Bi-70]